MCKKRIAAMNYKNVLYSIIVILLFTSVVGAESGKVVINDTQEKNYTHVYIFEKADNWVTEYDVLFDKLYFDNSSWDHMSALTINLTNDNKVHWAFNDNSVITSSDIVLSYDKNIFTNLDRRNYFVQYYKDCSPDANEPAFVRVEEGGCS